MRKGFVLDNERLKNLGGGSYFKELLERIRDIRADAIGIVLKFTNTISWKNLSGL